MNPKEIEGEAEHSVDGTLPTQINLQTSPIELVGDPGAASLALHAVAAAGEVHVAEELPADAEEPPAPAEDPPVAEELVAAEDPPPVVQDVAPEDVAAAEEPPAVEDVIPEEATAEELLAMQEAAAARRPRMTADFSKLTIEVAAERSAGTFSGRVAAPPSFAMLSHCIRRSEIHEGDVELTVEANGDRGTLYALRFCGSPEQWIFVNASDGAAFKIDDAGDAARVAEGGNPDYWGQRLLPADS